MKEKNKKLLCFVGHYLPDYTSGGPVRSIENFVNLLGDEFDIKIICNNHDSLKKKLFKNIKNDAWQRVGKASVFYASKNTLNLRAIKKLMSETTHDILYINSFFSYKFSLLPLIARTFKNVSYAPCIIAPRGEFSTGAIKIKFFKKKCYLLILKLLGLSKGLFWQASSNFEKKDIIREIGSIAKRIYIAPNLTLPVLNVDLKITKIRKPGQLRILFLSRISPKKNLSFILRVLLKINFPLELSIYGPKSDLVYWKKCLNLINKLPSNINVIIKDEVSNNQVQKIFERHDLFVFPTLGENFGHVIFESLKSGTPVLVSNQTPWLSNAEGGLQVLSLDENKWINTINVWTKFDDNILLKKRKEAIKYILNYNNNSTALKKNKKFFNSILNNKSIV